MKTRLGLALVGLCLALPAHGQTPKKSLRFHHEHLQRTVGKLVDGATPRIESSSLADALKEIARGAKIEILTEGLTPEALKRKIEVKPGPLGKTLRGSLASHKLTWAVRPDGALQILKSRGTPSKPDAKGIKTTALSLGQPCDLEFDSQSLPEVVDFMASISGLSFVFAKEELEGLEVSMEGKGMALGMLITVTFEKRGLRLFLRPDGKLEIRKWPPAATSKNGSTTKPRKKTR